MQLVVVKFRDPTTDFDRWSTDEEVDKAKCHVCFAVGMLLEENEDVTKVGLLCSEDKKSKNGWITIPTPCIISCDVIKEVDWEVVDA